MTQVVAQFEKLANQYSIGGLPREDRAVIAERQFSGTHRVAAKVEQDAESQPKHAT